MSSNEEADDAIVDDGTWRLERYRHELTVRANKPERSPYGLVAKKEVRGWLCSRWGLWPARETRQARALFLHGDGVFSDRPWRGGPVELIHAARTLWPAIPSPPDAVREWALEQWG